MAATVEDDEYLDPFFVGSLGLGLGLGLFIINQAPPTLKPLSTAIKLADGAIKVLHSPSSPQTLIIASKALIKGYKASSRLIPIKPRSPRISPILLRRLKASIATINLIRCNEFLGLGFVRGGYKISKNFARVLEGFVGVQLDSAVKHGIDSLGLLVKALAVAREVARFRRRKNGLGFGSRVDRRSEIRLRCKRLHFDGDCSLKLLPFRDNGVFGAKDSEVSLSDLLCLSIPLHEVFPRSV